MSSLKLTDLNKVYPSGETALYNVSLEADDNEFLVIVGGEKCGKSTLLRVIAGIEEATSGTVCIGGKDVTDADPKDRDVAMVFQSNSLNPSLNVFDNMAFGLRIRKAPEALVQERVKAVAEILGLTDVLYRKPKALTAAAKQRAAIGRAIVREPRLYLFDEPLAGLDEKLRLDMLNIIINLQARVSGTFVYATKNLSEAMTIGSRIAVLNNGFVQQVDTPANLYDYPANTFVAFLIGSPTVNFVRKVKIISENGVYYGVNGSFKIAIPENITARFKSVSEYAGKNKYVTLGIRPEDAKIVVGADIKAKVLCVEGDNEKYAECAVTPDISLTVSVQTNYSKGTDVEISIDNTRLYIFDAETCLNLLERDSGYTETGKRDAGFTPLPYDEEHGIYENLKQKKQQKKK